MTGVLEAQLEPGRSVPEALVKAADGWRLRVGPERAVLADGRAQGG